MTVEDLESMLNKRVKGVGTDMANDRYFVIIMTTHGKQFVFSSDSPIYLDVETEQ